MPRLPGHENCPHCNEPASEAIRRARLCLEAMRQPTEAMEIVAGRDRVSDDHNDPYTTWLLMIDEALR